MRILMFLFVFLIAIPLARDGRRDLFIVWNIGQGLWSTLIEGERCLHIDAGGEKWPRRELSSRCSRRVNEFFFSHWDLDHVGGLRIARALFPQICIGVRPAGVTASRRKLALFAGLSECPGPRRDLTEINWVRHLRNSNSESRIFIWRNQILFPGDSPSGEEKIWSQLLPRPEKIRWLIAGHHGSRTSTSLALLSRLSGLKEVLISARQKKYGHPHREVAARLREFHRAMIKTEDWGNLLFEIN